MPLQSRTPLTVTPADVFRWPDSPAADSITAMPGVTNSPAARAVFLS